MNATGRSGSVVGGKYRLVRLLGEGGMGEVYEAQHAIIGRRFAIKFLHAHLTRNPELMARFQREAQAAGALENENIAAALDFGMTEDGAPFLVMEFLEGEDLSRLLARSGSLPVARAVNIVIQACRGLVAAHDRGIVHRDLKPENLFICRRNDRSDLVKVLDFGIAKLRDRDAVTRSGATMGTPSYMSSEQARGARDVDHRTDIYALGVILYETLSGAKPHPGTSYNEIIYHIMTEAPRPLASLGNLPSGLCAVVERAMLREASARFASVVDLAEALAPFAGQPVAPLRTETALPVVDALAPHSGTSPLPMEAAAEPALWGNTACLPAGDGASVRDTTRAPGRRRLRLWGLVVGVAALGAGTWLLRSPKTATRDAGVAPTPVPSRPVSAAPAAHADAGSGQSADAAVADSGRQQTVDARPGRARAVRLPPPRPPVGEGHPSPTLQRKTTRPFDRANPYDD